ncbi:GvpL/GvpF family gas vesicle protein [Virgibacillus sp. YIM 98842]|uniref:GvpL/GvpF family gas vesicle protein n=1 Tax=Virgibacillus sp. YIM 98842 TaxID=2663533 RepID=UPI0013DCDEAF|nr:GvpL/GvpF family gas vesicle protein [Virgibacillus sp. YIM 98842]
MMEGQKTGIYIFCGIQTEEETAFGDFEMEGDTRTTFTIHYKDAAMVAAEVPMKIYHPNKQNLMMHQQILARVMKENDTVIPISFGNIFKSREDVKVLLENLYPQFEELFPKIKGKIEVGLKVIGKKDWLRKRVHENPQVGKIAQSVQRKSEAAGYYDRIQLGDAAQNMITGLQKEIEADIYTPLETEAEAAAINDPISETMLLNASFLINRDKEEKFDELVNEAHDKWKDYTDFNYTGPWPAYNFINIRLTVEEA